ncbi:SDR family NAD(P)-dependent oxidoreductase [Pikeienuella sp. HZG-20]|uniref:SDR family NAD(P)-dependent oxidoreductase n=1 Tax=Paludibacillus litoralis TaxID=3133267 RepID=UPI0030EEC147
MTKRTILITGCASGIGEDAATTLRARGWRVFATCRREADAARLREAGFESWRLDYEDEESVAAGAAEALARSEGRLDALFNNGAWALPGPAEDLPRDGLRAIFEANLFGPHQLAAAVLPAMRAAGGGRIVNCSSVLGMVAAPYRGAYNATKFALEGLTDTLRRELAGAPVEIVLIAPGPILTPFRRNSRAPYERWMRPARAGSSHPQEIWSEIERRLYKDKKGGRFDLQPAAVTAKLIRALEDPRPRARYLVTTPTYLADILRRVLPTRALDRVIGRR